MQECNFSVQLFATFCNFLQFVFKLRRDWETNCCEKLKRETNKNLVLICVVNVRHIAFLLYFILVISVPIICYC